MGKNMLDGKVIYEKAYPEPDVSEMELEATGQPSAEAEKLTFNEIMEKLTRGRELVLLPQRQESAKAFVNTAARIAEMYGIDVKITQFDSHVTVDYCFNCSGCMGFLKEVLVYADDISFSRDVKGFDIMLSIDHYTHAVYRNGRKMRPMD